MDAAMWYVIDNGITDETTYPYKARDQKCSYKDTQKVYQIKNCAEVTANKTAALVEAVATQPVAISVEADQAGFQFYKSGVFNGKCGTDLDHGVLCLGYFRFCWLVMEHKMESHIGRPRTHGEDHGEAAATSFSVRELMDQVSVVSLWTTPSPFNQPDHIKWIFSENLDEIEWNFSMKSCGLLPVRYGGSGFIVRAL